MLRRPALVLISLLWLAQPLQAEPIYPRSNIRIVLGFNAGSAPDVAARILAERFRAKWDKPVVVENMLGAGGNIAADHVAKSEPDGTTLLMAGNAAIVINPSLYAKLSYDPAKDLVPVAQVTVAPNILVLNKDVPATSVQDLVDLARRSPGTLTFASAGLGTSTHLAGELFQTMAGIKLQHVPYRDSAALLSDLMAGRVTMFFGSIASVLPHVRDGGLRALAVTSLQRSPATPELPTLDELGFRGFDAIAWFGLMAPAGTPASVIALLHDEAQQAAAAPAAREKFASLGMESVTRTSDEFASQIRAETPKWAELIRRVGIAPIQ
ncbi:MULTISPECIES: Bug family tripartite tricarboxylate transporter substrate binding protein [Bradyrhizobium]|jgi:tripartite-type tricarboxylate transporter receptor subunit TctC|uniref:Bug family tripartite tricarboxylate transporter substrate binding protein n=1 Tax=Bradyrhizobium TaxID=374 RepID=UPI001BA5DDED|nr:MULTISPECIES: tripartite tricarboxylate transporter substrate binding protein [Bradyrhizobium]MBR0813282.1 tripartite tricarboxylate transporter substrate binding protein [Bradyrhizobium diazoefficiens]WOH70940.1 tripartite tricarboxylate transporter substrate binding protein [Bradyrhizobium sp. NDS-1]